MSSNGNFVYDSLRPTQTLNLYHLCLGSHKLRRISYLLPQVISDYLVGFVLHGDEGFLMRDGVTLCVIRFVICHSFLMSWYLIRWV